MNQIKFSHHYTKMPRDISNTELIEVLISDTSELHGSFVNYDTFYSNGFYPLPKGKILILLLWSICETEKNQLWTTIRRWTPEKEKYYRSIRGKRIGVVIL